MTSPQETSCRSGNNILCCFPLPSGLSRSLRQVGQMAITDCYLMRLEVLEIACQCSQVRRLLDTTAGASLDVGFSSATCTHLFSSFYLKRFHRNIRRKSIECFDGSFSRELSKLPSNKEMRRTRKKYNSSQTITVVRIFTIYNASSLWSWAVPIVGMLFHMKLRQSEKQIKKALQD